jgi:hypothetical protein
LFVEQGQEHTRNQCFLLTVSVCCRLRLLHTGRGFRQERARYLERDLTHRDQEDNGSSIGWKIVTQIRDGGVVWLKNDMPAAAHHKNDRRLPARVAAPGNLFLGFFTPAFGAGSRASKAKNGNQWVYCTCLDRPACSELPHGCYLRYNLCCLLWRL